MIYVLLAYLLFQILYDHWSDPGPVWDAIYFAVQYSTVGAVAWLQFARTRSVAYMLIGSVFIGFAANELTYLYRPGPAYEMMTSGPPALTMTVIAGLLFILYEIITRWKKRTSGLRGRI